MGRNFGNTAGGYESETRGGAAKVGTNDDEDESRIDGSVYKDSRAEWTAARI